MGNSEMLRIAVMRAVIELYRAELLVAAGFFESGEDPDLLLYRVVLEAERRHARDHGLDRRALVLDKEFREVLVDSSSDFLVDDEEAADELIEAIVAEAERRWVCQIIGVEVFDVEGDDEIVRRRPRRRRPRRRCGRDGDEEGSTSDG